MIGRKPLCSGNFFQPNQLKISWHSRTAGTIGTSSFLEVNAVKTTAGLKFWVHLKKWVSFKKYIYINIYNFFKIIFIIFFLNYRVCVFFNANIYIFLKNIYNDCNFIKSHTVFQWLHILMDQIIWILRISELRSSDLLQVRKVYERVRKIIKQYRKQLH